MENECEALPGVAYPGVRDNRSIINTKTGYDDMMKFSSHSAHSKQQPVHLLVTACTFGCVTGSE